MTRVVLRIDFDEEKYMGHGRVRLLELVGELGSIAQAAKAMDMSYKRAWYLLEAFGQCFGEPLVVRQHGGKGGGSAQLTELGREVVTRYRRMETLARKALEKEIASLERHLANRQKKRAASGA